MEERWEGRVGKGVVEELTMTRIVVKGMEKWRKERGEGKRVVEKNGRQDRMGQKRYNS